MAGIRVNTGVKRIEVNDAGEYIELNFADQSMAIRFYEMQERIQEKTKEAEKQLNESKKDNDNIRKTIEINNDLHKYIMHEVDACFGPDTCRKVFGNIVPGADLFEDFFNQLLPYFEKGAEERKAKMAKYNADRTGNV